jgi:hypothetical protein
MFVLGWLGAIFGIAGLVTGNVFFLAGGSILLFVYAFNFKKQETGNGR